MKNNYKLNTTWIICMLLMTLSGCEKFLETDPPPSKIATEDVFSSDITATAAVLDIYGDFLTRPSFASGDETSISSLTGLSSDELVNWGYDINSLQFEANELKFENSHVLALWSSLYRSIYRTNLIKEQLEISQRLSSDVKNQLIGEVLFARAFCNFYLVNLFGDVPLVLTSDYIVNSSIGRTEATKVYEQIIADLTDAQELLSDKYVATNGERIRPNKYTAIALKARVHLYLQDWQSAEETATEIISNSTVYSLKDDLNTVFLKNSTETIWQLMPYVGSTGTGATEEASTFSPDFGLFAYNYLRAGSVRELDENDLRATTWIDAFILDTDTIFYPVKYKQYDDNAPITEYSMVFRLAEQYLIRAEARAMQNKIAGLNSAEEDVNVIRNRANLSPISGTSQNSILDAIMEERRVEFLTEWGHRWFDLKRTGRANNVLSAIKPEWQITDTLLPLPQSEMSSNPLLKPQNAGY